MVFFSHADEIGLAKENHWTVKSIVGTLLFPHFPDRHYVLLLSVYPPVCFHLYVRSYGYLISVICYLISFKRSILF